MKKEQGNYPNYILVGPIKPLNEFLYNYLNQTTEGKGDMTPLAMVGAELACWGVFWEWCEIVFVQIMMGKGASKLKGAHMGGKHWCLTKKMWGQIP